MLYVDLMLRRFASIGRESVIFRALNAMPISLTALFELFEQECMKGRTYEQLTVLKALFAWMTYSQRALTISEASMIITQTVRILQDHGFAEKTQALRDARLLHNENEIIDIEGEITGRCARYD